MTENNWSTAGMSRCEVIARIQENTPYRKRRADPSKQQLRDMGIKLAAALVSLCTTGDGSEPTAEQRQGMELVHEFKRIAGV